MKISPTRLFFILSTCFTIVQASHFPAPVHYRQHSGHKYCPIVSVLPPGCASASAVKRLSSAPVTALFDGSFSIRVPHFVQKAMFEAVICIPQLRQKAVWYTPL
ncbi:MAG: hypothetical protein K6G90_06850 [Clostridia bacterium]|nr:hypothetical protein [Clostridia bacterium]